MKVSLIFLCVILIGLGTLVAFELDGNISGEMSSGFPTEFAEDLRNGDVIRFDSVAKAMPTICLVHEYTDAKEFLVERGVSNPPNLYVGELHALIVLETEEGQTEYLGLTHAQTVSLKDLVAGCGSTKGVVWQPVRSMKLGEKDYPVYAQTEGEKLK